MMPPASRNSPLIRTAGLPLARLAGGVAGELIGRGEVTE
jgi:hypothetical protein